MVKHFSATILAATIAVCGIGDHAVAQMPADYIAKIGGKTLTCRTYADVQVRIVSNPYLNDIGMAGPDAFGRPTIQLNPNVMGQFSPLVQIWWFAHECGHHALIPAMNSESNADCWGIKTMRNMRLIRRPSELSAFVVELANLQGDAAGHLPGPYRAAQIKFCAMT